MSIKALAFDLDGTLVNSSTDLANAANAARAALGLPALATSIVEGYVGDGADIMVARAIADNKAATWVGSAEQQTGLASFDAHYAEHLADNTRFYPHVQNVLHTLSPLNLPMAVVTNKPERYTLTLLERLGILDLFAVVVGGDSLPTRKPDAGPLLHVAQQLELQPNEIMMVGDSKNDALCARNAGCVAAIVSHGYGQDLANLGADLIFHNFTEVLAAVGR